MDYSLVPMLCMGMPDSTLCVAAACLGARAFVARIESRTRRSLEYGIPMQSMGTRLMGLLG